MRIPRLLRVAPLTCLFLSSWACGLVGLALGLSAEQGLLGGVWASLAAPAYGFAMAGAVLGTPFPLWVFAALIVLGLADYGIHLLVLAGRAAIAWMADRLGTEAAAAAATYLRQLSR